MLSPPSSTTFPYLERALHGPGWGLGKKVSSREKRTPYLIRTYIKRFCKKGSRKFFPTETGKVRSEVEGSDVGADGDTTLE